MTVVLEVHTGWEVVGTYSFLNRLIPCRPPFFFTNPFKYLNKMTKVIILGEEPKKTELQKIEFKTCIGRQQQFSSATILPAAFDDIELICRNYTSKMDLMFAYDSNDRNTGLLYLGHFNDGIV